MEASAGCRGCWALGRGSGGGLHGEQPGLGCVREDGEGLGTFLVNPITYVVIPLVVQLLAGARPSTLGFAGVTEWGERC